MKFLPLLFYSCALLAQGSIKPNIKSTQKIWTPTYVLALEIRQEHFSLSITQQLKDEMNAATFQIPVTKEYYDSVQVGTVLNDDFRAGSFIFHGSFGNWKVKVINKAIF